MKVLAHRSRRTENSLHQVVPPVRFELPTPGLGIRKPAFLRHTRQYSLTPNLTVCQGFCSISVAHHCSLTLAVAAYNAYNLPTVNAYIKGVYTMPHLTKALVSGAKAPANGQAFLRDEVITGFALRVIESGAKSFVWDGNRQAKS